MNHRKKEMMTVGPENMGKTYSRQMGIGRKEGRGKSKRGQEKARE